MGLFVDLTGEQYERWRVISRAPNGASGARRWNCRCDCGSYGVVHASSLKSGASSSCGCLKKESTSRRRRVHGQSGSSKDKRRSPEYRCWTKMTQRCSNPKDPSYHRYGARGIAVAERWQTFANFFADMGCRPTDEHSLEREDNDLGYGPDNCVWATRTVQARNRPGFNRYVKYKDRVVPVSEAVEMAGSVVRYQTARNRLRRGWSIEDAVEAPALARNSIPPALRPALRKLAIAAHCSLAKYIVSVLTEHVAEKRKAAR